MVKTPLVIRKTFVANGEQVDAHLFVVPPGAEYEVISVSEVHTVLGTDGGAVTGDLKVCDPGETPTNGASVLSSTFNLKSTINTPVTKTPASGLGTKIARRLTAGQTLAWDFGGVLTALVGTCVTVVLAELRPPTYRQRS